jgi:hypothetical protein
VIDIAGPHAAAQPVGGVIGDADRLGLVPVADHRQDGTGGLLLGDPHGVVHLCKQRRLDVVALLQSVRGIGTASGHPGPFGDAEIDVSTDPVALAGGDPGADEGRRVVRIADDGRRDHLRQCRNGQGK